MAASAPVTRTLAAQTVGDLALELDREVLPSDRNIKENIRLIGSSLNGHNVYEFTYKDTNKHYEGIYQGVMAQEVPFATVEVDGELWVDYSKLDVTFKRI